MVSASTFDVVFDITTSGFPNVFETIFGVALGGLVALILLLVGKKGWWLGLGFSALWGGLFVATSFVPHLQLKQLAAAGECERIEGVVSNYVPQPYEGHAPGDRFSIGGRAFEISNFTKTPGYMRAVAYGGVHLAGRHVRACVVGDNIAKLEVQRQAWPEALSTVTFRLNSGDDQAFSKQLYNVTQRRAVRCYPVVWAKDFALSDYDLTIAGECEGAVAELEPVVAEAAKGIANGAKIVSAFRASAKCQRSPAPPERSWKAPPPVLFYKSEGAVTTAAPEGASPVVAIDFPKRAGG